MYLVSGISGEPLYAAMASSSEEWLGASSKLDASAYNSAQFYSTSNPSGFIDGASASAIASSYQVVSATATQLYAGTAYLTSVNGTPVSAARAGNASNASLATSAWYDGTGRLISALPDSADVSAIASSYVESGVSSKQDTLSFAYNTADQISSINGSALGGMDEAAVSGIASAYAESAVSSKADASALSGYYTTANESGFITGVDLTNYATTSYVDSAVSSKADSSSLSSYVPYSSLEYNTASAISGINGSALAAGSTYSAGEGIDITDDVISVETPVDIVAGPGIVIDNPDGNTLRVSVAQAEEVVLYDAGDSPSQAGPWQISEARTNFEWLDIVFGNDTTGSMKQVTRFAADSEYMKLHLPRYDEEPSYKWSTMTLSWNNTTASIKTNSVGRFTIASNGSVSVSTAAAQAPYLFQIIGVHRINGGN